MSFFRAFVVADHRQVVCPSSTVRFTRGHRVHETKLSDYFDLVILFFILYVGRVQTQGRESNNDEEEPDSLIH